MSLRGNRNPTIRQAALEYATEGYPIFPVRPNKQPATEHGFLDATTDSDRVAKWFPCGTHYGIGCAIPENVVVLDLDSSDTQTKLDREGYYIPPTVHAKTPRGGDHFWFDACGFQVAQRTRIWPNVDTRVGNKGYIILPPTPGYRWEVPLLEAELAPIPQWLVEAAGEAADLETISEIAHTAWAAAADLQIKSGCRNASIYTLALSLAYNAEPKTDIPRLVWHLNEIACQPPLDRDELRHIVQQALRRAKKVRGASLPTEQEMQERINRFVEGGN